MVMRPGPDPRRPALTAVRRPRVGIWWLWGLVLVLAGTAAYSGYLLAAARQQLMHADANRLALDAQTTHLQSELAKLGEDNRASTALVTGLQKRLHGLQEDLAAARAAADASKAEAERLAKEVADAKAAFAQVAKLQERVTALKAERASARTALDDAHKEIEHLKADAALNAEAKAMLERQVRELEGKVGEMQRKLESANAAAAPTTP